jgi:type II restriction/modification system DNA methylase subunit YeeA
MNKRVTSNLGKLQRNLQGRKFNKNICNKIFDIFVIQFYNEKLSPKINVFKENCSEIVLN